MSEPSENALDDMWELVKAFQWGNSWIVYGEMSEELQAKARQADITGCAIRMLDGKCYPVPVKVLEATERFLDGMTSSTPVSVTVVEPPAPPKRKRRIEYERFFPDIR